jgi:surface antigen
MAGHDQDVHSDRFDENEEQKLNEFSSENAQLMDALREHYLPLRAQSGRTLTHAWERIQQGQHTTDTPILPGARTGTWVPIHQTIERQRHMKEKQPGRLKRIINGLAAAVILTAVIASMLLVYGHLHTQTNTASGGLVTPTITASGDPGVTPTSGCLSTSSGPGITPITSTASGCPVTPTSSPSGCPGVTPTVSASPSPEVSPTPTNGTSSEVWPFGGASYWANLRYHQLSGFWVSWTGNDDQWVAGAHAAGWNVSQTPHLSSIIVLMPYVQGASAYGVVGIVESVVNSTTVHVSIMNWNHDGGGFDIVSYANFTVGSGVYFIWK